VALLFLRGVEAFVVTKRVSKPVEDSVNDRVTAGVTGRVTRHDAQVAATGGVIMATADESLLDLIDNLLNRGVLLHGELVLGLADVDLVYARLSLLLCAADRVLPPR
jgi:hypothetical protein